jgi:hypothetical protein
MQIQPAGKEGIRKNWFPTLILWHANPETRPELNPNEWHHIRFANTYFYTKLTEDGEYNYKNVKRWTAKIDIFECDKMIIPINVVAHPIMPNPPPTTTTTTTHTHTHT